MACVVRISFSDVINIAAVARNQHVGTALVVCTLHNINGLAAPLLCCLGRNLAFWTYALVNSFSSVRD